MFCLLAPAHRWANRRLVAQSKLRSWREVFKHIPWSRRILEYRDTSGPPARSPVYLGHCHRYWFCTRMSCLNVEKANGFTITSNPSALRLHGDCSMCSRPSICGCQNLIMSSITEQLQFSDTRCTVAPQLRVLHKSHCALF